MAAERLQKYLARAGVASRRHAEELITAGRVTVNNEKVTELGSKVSPGDLVTVDGQLVTPPEECSYFLLYKPVGVVTTLSDPQGRPTVADYIEQAGKRLFPVGRLDYDAEGALLITDDGALAHKLTHPSFQVPRTYLAKVKGTPDAATLDKLRGGVRLEDGMATPVSVDVFEQAERNTWLKLVVAEGRPHLIKRLCAAVGSPVVRLYRPSYAGITVESLRPGEMRPLTESEVRRLTEVADGKATPNEKSLKLPPRRHGRAAPGFEVEDDGDDEDYGEEAAAPVKSRVAAKPKPAGASRPERPERGAARAERPARAASRPDPKEMGPRGDGGARPAFRSASGGRAERRTWTPREEEHEGASAPRGEEREARGARPERREWAPRGADRGARPVRKSFGAGGAERRGPPRGEGGERPERGARKPFGAGAERRSPPRGEGGERPERGARKPFGAGAERRSPPRGEGGERPERGARKPFGFGGGAERRGPPRGEGGERGARPARKPFGFGGGAERRGPPRGEGEERGARAARKPFGAGTERRSPPRGEGGERPERGARKPFGFGGGAERRGPPRGEGEERGARPARKPFGFGGGAERRGPPRGEGEERGARPARKPFGFGGSAERRGPPRGDRPERGAGPGPRGAGGARPERKTWSPAGEGSDRPARRGAARPGGEGAGEGKGGFVDWRAKKSQGPKAEWQARPSRGGAGGPPRGRGPRKGR
ncbi:pseudouridine synthase [Archangium sp.]|uniref:pseudouridine synthase n=1 Tax=Archangium sp. TaxID=1872627 RepID=UPI00286BC8CE|nr:pseudouridine synthase [Archangium sp.]